MSPFSQLFTDKDSLIKIRTDVLFTRINVISYTTLKTMFTNFSIEKMIELKFCICCLIFCNKNLNFLINLRHTLLML